MDDLILRSKVEAAANLIKNRGQVVGDTHSQSTVSLPEHYHELWASALQGRITMYGNFAFDAFSQMWLDFGVPIWDNLFVVRGRTHVLTAGSFETIVELYSEQGDPLNARALESAQVIEKRERLARAEVDLVKARRTGRQAAINAAERVKKKAEEDLNKCLPGASRSQEVSKNRR